MNNCKSWKEIINYRSTMMVLAEDDKWYISSCNNNLCNNPIYKKKYVKDGKEYLYWIPHEDILSELSEKYPTVFSKQ